MSLTPCQCCGAPRNQEPFTFKRCRTCIKTKKHSYCKEVTVYSQEQLKKTLKKTLKVELKFESNPHRKITFDQLKKWKSGGPLPPKPIPAWNIKKVEEFAKPIATTVDIEKRLMTGHTVLSPASLKSLEDFKK